MKKRVSIFIAVISLWCITNGYIPLVANAELYQWSNPSPHHAAVVQVQSGDRGGSGAYVQVNDFRFVLTAAHVCGSKHATVTFQDGTVVEGKTTIDRYYNGNAPAYDLGAVVIDGAPNITPVQIADNRQKADIEICGYGGPGNRLRHYVCRVTDVGQTIFTSNGKVINGDSGGPWFENGQIVGVSSSGDGGEVARTGDDRYHVYALSVSPSTVSIRSFANRIHDKFCAGSS